MVLCVYLCVYFTKKKKTVSFELFEFCWNAAHLWCGWVQMTEARFLSPGFTSKKRWRADGGSPDGGYSQSLGESEMASDGAVYCNNLCCLNPGFRLHVTTLLRLFNSI